MKESKTSIEKNPYKIAFFAVLGILILALLFYGVSSYLSSTFNNGVQQGQINTFGALTQSVAQNGFVTLSTEEFNLTLVPQQSLLLAQEQVILTIMNEVRSQGYVVLFDNETQMALVQIDPAQLEAALDENQ
jgi:hypothetical protein